MPCSNDAFDAAMGVDGAKVESLVNITGNRLGCLAVANAFLALGLSLLGQAIWHLVSDNVTVTAFTVDVQAWLQAVRRRVTRGDALASMKSNKSKSPVA